MNSHAAKGTFPLVFFFGEGVGSGYRRFRGGITAASTEMNHFCRLVK